MAKLTNPNAAMPRQGKLFLVILLVSLLIHISSYISLPVYELTNRRDAKTNDRPHDPIKVRVTQRSAPEIDKRIVETPMKETESPDNPTVLGAQDHKTARETKLKRSEISPVKAANAGPKGLSEKSAAAAAGGPEAKAIPHAPKMSMSAGLPVPSMATPRNAYENLLNTAVAEMQGQIDAGYQEFIDEKAIEGDRIDLNTQEYRYVGYFTAMRKSIELVWNYPMAAVRKGLQGTVNLEFTIHANGEVTQIKVIKTSGYQILDKAIVDAIKLASPFAPLPTGFGKKKIVITGAFNYILG